MREREGALLRKVAKLPVAFGRGLGDRSTLAYKLATKGHVTPYMAGYRDVPEKAYVVNDLIGADVLFALAAGYDSGFYNFADFRSKVVTPPAVRQEVSPPGFEWNEQASRYEQVVWRGTLKPDREGQK